MPTFDTLYWDTNGSGGGLVGGSGTWSTSVTNWNQNGDGSGTNVVWTNGTLKEADFSAGGGTITLGGNITCGRIYGGTLNITGSYILTLGYGITNSTLTANVPVTGTSDPDYGFQAIVGNNLNFRRGMYCNFFNFGNPTIVSSSFYSTNQFDNSQFNDSFTLNCSSTISGYLVGNSSGVLTITATNTASVNNTFSSYGCTVTSNGLLNINNSFELASETTFNGSGLTNINGDLTNNSGLTKSGTGTLFLSGTRNGGIPADIKINQGTFKIKPDVSFSNTNFICSGTLNILGNTSVGGNVTFATGTLRLGI